MSAVLRFSKFEERERARPDGLASHVGQFPEGAWLADLLVLRPVLQRTRFVHENIIRNRDDVLASGSLAAVRLEIRRARSRTRSQRGPSFCTDPVPFCRTSACTRLPPRLLQPLTLLSPASRSLRATPGESTGSAPSAQGRRRATSRFAHHEPEPQHGGRDVPELRALVRVVQRRDEVRERGRVSVCRASGGRRAQAMGQALFPGDGGALRGGGGELVEVGVGGEGVRLRRLDGPRGVADVRYFAAVGVHERVEDEEGALGALVGSPASAEVS